MLIYILCRERLAFNNRVRLTGIAEQDCVSIIMQTLFFWRTKKKKKKPVQVILIIRSYFFFLLLLLLANHFGIFRNHSTRIFSNNYISPFSEYKYKRYNWEWSQSPTSRLSSHIQFSDTKMKSIVSPISIWFTQMLSES